MSSRIISIRISATTMNLSIIQIYAPTTDYDGDEIGEFYEMIEERIPTIPRKYLLIIQGHCSEKVGRYGHGTWPNTTGKYGFGITNPRGYQLLKFAQKNELILSNTFHTQKYSMKSTWHSPNGNIHHQHIYILTTQRYNSSINKASTRAYN